MRKVVAIILIIGCIVGVYTLSRGNSLRALKEKDVDQRDLYMVQRTSIASNISGSGFVRPMREKDLVLPSGGRIEELKITKGQGVKEGELLASLYNTSSKESPVDYFLYAPFSGLIVDVYVEHGDIIAALKPVARLIDDSQYLIGLNIDEMDIYKIKLGQPVQITINALPRVVFQGEVVDIGLVAIRQSGLVTFPVQIQMDNIDPAIKPGMSADVRITTAKVGNALTVPITAIAYNEDGAYVTRKMEDKLVPTKVVLGISDDLMVEILEGIEEGDLIIINNYQADKEFIKQQRRGFLSFSHK